MKVLVLCRYAKCGITPAKTGVAGALLCAWFSYIRFPWVTATYRHIIIGQFAEKISWMVETVLFLFYFSNTYRLPVVKYLMQIDVNVTEAANEAKDNVKFLYTLERFIEPLYSGTATTIIDTLPALMNSIKMIHTIARYY